MQDLLDQYQTLLQKIDSWFSDCMQHAGDQIVCHLGCSGCCRGLFEISLLDACLLQRGFAGLEQKIKEQVLGKAQRRVNELQTVWPEFQPPYILQQLPHNDWEEMPEEDETPCPLLSDAGLCLVYAYRPMTCRLHGLPNIDCSGQIFSDQYCSLNLINRNPLTQPGLRYPFAETFRQEYDLLGRFSERLLGRRQLELDTFIPSALLIDFSA